jgi:hypothetical protein
MKSCIIGQVGISIEWQFDWLQTFQHACIVAYLANNTISSTSIEDFPWIRIVVIKNKESCIIRQVGIE